MSADPHEVLEDLDDGDDAECIYIRDGPAYLWNSTAEDTYVLLEQTQSGSWYPRGMPISSNRAAGYLEQATEYDVRPQTELPPGRHERDRE